MATISAIVPAAGHGVRAGLNANKIFAPLAGRPLLSWTLDALQNAPYEALGLSLGEIIVAARPDEWSTILGLLEFQPRLVPGGPTRQDSVFEAVRAARGEWILVHDAARPCVSPDVLIRTLQAALETGAALAALPASDTIKQTANSSSCEVAQTLDRATIWLAQTPQIFRRTLFLESLEAAAREEFVGTDCASIVERAGHAVALVEGETNNFKVTFSVDFERAAQILQPHFQARNLVHSTR